MRPVQTARANTVLVGPPGVGDLHAERLEVDGVPWVLSTWTLTDEERQLVVAGHNIGLLVQMRSHPVVSMRVVEDQGVADDDPEVRRRLDEWSTREGAA